MKGFLAIISGIIGFLYLLNPTFGIFELIPDNLFFVGNLDEAVATGLVLNCLAYFGIDLLPHRKRKETKKIDDD